MSKFRGFQEFTHIVNSDEELMLILPGFSSPSHRESPGTEVDPNVSPNGTSEVRNELPKFRMKFTKNFHVWKFN